jgi:prepilin-type N-terminal cleavage/methylation domain-containing protein
MKRTAFSLIEVLLVVAIIGILAAIAVPHFTEYSARAREAAAKDIIRTMRSQIELYRAQHQGTAPGYINGNPAPTAALQLQFAATSTVTGQVSTSTVPTDPFLYGPYIRKPPKNPFNGLTNIAYVDAATDFAVAADGTSSGWLYKKETAEFRLNWTGTDSKGDNFYDY